MTERKHIHVSKEGEFTCLCGNVASSDGFDPCNYAGLAMEPTEEWPGLYRCNQCMLIIRGECWIDDNKAKLGKLGDIETDFYAKLYKKKPNNVVKLLRIHDEWPGNPLRKSGPELKTNSTSTENDTIKHSYRLAMLCLQSDRYQNDVDFKEATDLVLADCPYSRVLEEEKLQKIPTQTIVLPKSVMDKLYSEHSFCCLEYSPTTGMFIENVLKCAAEAQERERI